MISSSMVHQAYRGQRERGAVLLVALLMLLLITIVTFSTMETSTLESQLATAAEQKSITFQMAEAAVAQATRSRNALGVALRASDVNPANPTWPTAPHALAGYDVGNRKVTCGADGSTGQGLCIGVVHRGGSRASQHFGSAL